MTIAYSPMLGAIALFETKIQAPKVVERRKRGETDDDERYEWEELDITFPVWEAHVVKQLEETRKEDESASRHLKELHHDVKFLKEKENSARLDKLLEKLDALEASIEKLKAN